MNSQRCPAGHDGVGRGATCRRCRTAFIAQRITEADPDLDPVAIEAAIAEVCANGAVIRDVLNALEDGAAALLVGAPAVVGRLVVALRAGGSTLPEPTCVRCGRTDRPLTTSPEGGACSRCRRRQLAEPCVGCEVIKPVAGRDAKRRPLCAACAPRQRRRCSSCGQVRVISRRARGDDGDLCERCYRGPVATCRACGQERRCHFVTEGRPICVSCSPRREVPCAHCGASRPASVRWPEGPVCEPCYRAALNRRGVCAGCAQERRLMVPPGAGARLCASCGGVEALASCRCCGVEQRPYRHGLCVRCALEERVQDQLGPAGGPLESVRAAIAASPQPYSAHNWLRSSASASLMRELAAGTLTLDHEALDARPERRAADFLRHVLVANGVLVPRDEAIVSLESWVAAKLARIDNPERRALLRSYANWRLLRRARRRAEGSVRPRTPTAHAKNCLNAGIALLTFLDDQGRDLATCSQADIDTWACKAAPGTTHAIADFVDWARPQKLLSALDVPRRQRQDGKTLDDDDRWAVVARLLHDKDLDLTDRVGGCLVLLFGQQLSRIVALRRDQLSVKDDIVALRLGPCPIEVPEPLGGLLVRLASSGRAYRGVGSPPATPWLFPGLDAGRPLNPSHLGERLRKVGITTMAGRRSALAHLASRLPAAVLADLLHIHPTTAVRWVNAAGGDWTTYAAHLLHDRDRPQRSSPG